MRVPVLGVCHDDQGSKVALVLASPTHRCVGRLFARSCLSNCGCSSHSTSLTVPSRFYFNALSEESESELVTSPVWLFVTLRTGACQAFPYDHGIIQTRILEWVAFLLQGILTQELNSAKCPIAGRFFTFWTTRGSHVEPGVICKSPGKLANHPIPLPLGHTENGSSRKQTGVYFQLLPLDPDILSLAESLRSSDIAIHVPPFDTTWIS